jgi:hypothetical protein
MSIWVTDAGLLLCGLPVGDLYAVLCGRGGQGGLPQQPAWRDLPGAALVAAFAQVHWTAVVMQPARI